jgi:hypothetical protein
MILYNDQLEVFFEFISTKYGGSTIIKRTAEEVERTKELARWMIGHRFMQARFFDFVDDKVPQGIEIYCSDKKFLDSVEDQWNLYLMALTQGES